MDRVEGAPVLFVDQTVPHQADEVMSAVAEIVEFPPLDLTRGAGVALPSGIVELVRGAVLVLSREEWR
jgi:hypothetical protein